MAPFGYTLITGKDSGSLLFRKYVSGPLYNKLFSRFNVFGDIDAFKIKAGDLDQTWTGFNAAVIQN